MNATGVAAAPPTAAADTTAPAAAAPASASASAPEAAADGSTTMSPREAARAEFYGTYDPMTGIRIAGTLGGFFSLMVLLVVYKSRCKGGSSRCSLAGDPAVQRAWAERLQQEADAAAEAEDRSRREQLAKMYAAAAVAERLSHRSSGSTRRSSRGTGTPRHLSSAASSCLGLNPGQAGGGRHCGLAAAAREAEAEAECAPAAGGLQLLAVPGGWSRRLSSVTCSSSDTSYLERRGSAVECGLPAPPPGAFRRLRPPLLPRCDDVRDWDFYYPIDIQVIQPTPDASPCGSERTLYAAVLPQAELVPGAASARPSLSRPASPASASLPPPAPPPRLAPLASISSCAASLRTDDCASVGSDSVFLDDDDVLDTEDEVEGFSTDSDDGDGGNRVRHFLQVPPTVRTFTPTKRWSDGAASYYRPRRLLPRQAAITSQLSASTEDAVAAAEVERVARRPPCPLPPEARHSSSSSSGSPTLKETRF